MIWWLAIGCLVVACKVGSNRTEMVENLDKEMTSRRGAELCQSIGHAAGAVTFGKGRSVTGSEFDRSTIECAGSKDGVRISLEFDSVKRK